MSGYGGAWGGAPPTGGGGAWGAPPPGAWGGGGAWGGPPPGAIYEFNLSATKLDNKDRLTGGQSDAYLVFKGNRMPGGGMGPLEPKLSTGGIIPGGPDKPAGSKPAKPEKTEKKKKGGLFGAAMKVAGAATGVGKPQCIGASDEWMMVYKTEIVYENLNPTWKPFQINLGMLAHNDINQPFVIECWDWDKIGAHDFIGYAKTTIREMQASKELKLLNPTRKLADGGFGKLAGTLVVNKVTQVSGPPPVGSAPAGGAWGAPPPGAWGGAPAGGAWGAPPPGAWGGAPPTGGGGAWGAPPTGGGGAWGAPPTGGPPPGS